MSIRSVVPNLSDVRNHLTKLFDPTDVIVKHDGSAIVKHAINRKSTVFYSIYGIYSIYSIYSAVTKGRFAKRHWRRSVDS